MVERRAGMLHRMESTRKHWISWTQTAPASSRLSVLWASIRSFESNLKWQKSDHLTWGAQLGGGGGGGRVNWASFLITAVGRAALHVGTSRVYVCVCCLYVSASACVCVRWRSRQGQGALPDKLEPAAISIFRQNNPSPLHRRLSF